MDGFSPAGKVNGNSRFLINKSMGISPRAPLRIVAFPAPPTWLASLLSSYSLPIIIIIQQRRDNDARQKRGARAAFRAKLIMPALGDPPKIKMPGLWRVFYKGFGPN